MYPVGILFSLDYDVCKLLRGKTGSHPFNIHRHTHPHTYTFDEVWALLYDDKHSYVTAAPSISPHFPPAIGTWLLFALVVVAVVKTFQHSHMLACF